MTTDIRKEFARNFHNRRQRASCLCGSSAGLPLRWLDRYGLDIVPQMCLSCGHIYQRYQLPQEDLDSFYAHTYRAFYGPNKALKSEQAYSVRVETARTVMLPVVLELFGNNRPLIVEWGCGAGWNLIPLKEAGFRVLGFDLDVEYTSYGCKTFSLDLRTIDQKNYKSSIDSIPSDAKLIVANHVLEHIKDPVAILGQLRDAMKTEGYLYIGLPFLELLPIWGQRDFYHIAHIHYFTMPYFQGLCRSLGLEVVKIEPKAGYLILRKGVATGAITTARMYTLALLTKYVILYSFAFPIGNVVKKLVRHWPALDRSLRRIKAKLTN